MITNITLPPLYLRLQRAESILQTNPTAKGVKAVLSDRYYGDSAWSVCRSNTLTAPQKEPYFRLMKKILVIVNKNWETEYLRTEGYLYVDKTALIYRLVILGKPYFRGKKELFKGLAIEQLEENWYEYPVLHLSLNAEKYDSAERLAKML